MNTRDRDDHPMFMACGASINGFKGPPGPLPPEALAYGGGAAAAGRLSNTSSRSDPVFESYITVAL